MTSHVEADQRTGSGARTRTDEYRQVIEPGKTTTVMRDSDVRCGRFGQSPGCLILRSFPFRFRVVSCGLRMVFVGTVKMEINPTQVPGPTHTAANRHRDVRARFALASRYVTAAVLIRQRTDQRSIVRTRPISNSPTQQHLIGEHSVCRVRFVIECSVNVEPRSIGTAAAIDRHVDRPSVPQTRLIAFGSDEKPNLRHEQHYATPPDAGLR